MWDDEKQQRFDTLRLKEAQGVLSEVEAQALQAFFAELEAEEAETLRKGMKRMDTQQALLRAEKERVEARNERLEAIVVEQEQLFAEARAYLTRLRSKQNELRAKYCAATGQKLVSSP